MQIRVMNMADVESVSNFISELNIIEESHIGYCGKDSKEIAHSLVEDISDIKYSESFVTAYEQNQLIGVLGFDADLGVNSAEIWGPFIKENKWGVVYSMWSEMIKLLPIEIHSISMFPNMKNCSVLKLAYNLSFIEHSKQTILTFHRDNRSDLKDVETIELTPEYFIDMKQLHNQAFPGTYYSGQQIIDRLDKHRKVFMLNDNNGLSGYIYVEAEPEFGEGSIEFFAVKESERGKGIGRHLLTIALKWLFTFETMDSTTLCVNTGNYNAISLYKKVGFQHIHDLCFFTKKI
ncbi:GNAT family N-acetyltransferase [Peribacillus butanolivorans]|uniref:GNAT family N-acetyltransferase n=1 Tax=Peribacillus butanolivorans TaxID=421767 RepID=UPI0037C7F544